MPVYLIQNILMNIYPWCFLVFCDSTNLPSHAYEAGLATNLPQSLKTCFDTGKSLSEALIFASTNPQFTSGRLFIELQVQYMKIPISNLGRACCVQKLFLTFRTIFVHNMFSPCSAKRRASDKDLPVTREFSKELSALSPATNSAFQ